MEKPIIGPAERPMNMGNLGSVTVASLWTWKANAITTYKYVLDVFLQSEIHTKL